MVQRVATVAFEGVEARPVDVQVQVSAGLPAFNLVGLADKAVTEAKERVRAALTASGLALPAQALEGFTVVGELALDGRIAPVAGVLPAAMGANARSQGLICPAACGPEAAWASPDMTVLAPHSLMELVNHFAGRQKLTRPEPALEANGGAMADLADVKGQESARRALEIAAAGRHNLLLCGPPGAGKSMLAQRLPSILPKLAPTELLEVSMIASVAGTLQGGALTSRRPFRAPHHSASMAAMVGGGLRARPGEVSLAHNGVLFLDELPEFAPAVLDSLRQPLESGEAVIARANHRVAYPARFQLVAAMNPCRCGRAGEPGHSCRRGPRCASDYQARISGPFLDRIDLHLDVPALSAIDLVRPAPAEPSAVVATRVIEARALQRQRFMALGRPDLFTNAEAGGPILEAIATPDEAGSALLADAARLMRLSARGYHRVLRVARTLADLAGAESLGRAHLAEALAYRAAADRPSAAA